MAESKEIYISSTLQVSENRSRVKISVVPEYNVDEQPFYLSFAIPQENENERIDYIPCNRGELIYKSSLPRKNIVFDINDQGELIVIGMDSLVSKISISGGNGTIIYDSRSWFLSEGYIDELGIITPEGVIISQPVV